MAYEHPDRAGGYPPSRVIPFRADTTAALAMTHAQSGVDGFWGESTAQQVLDAVKDNDAARAAFAALLNSHASWDRHPGPIDAGGIRKIGTVQERMAILATAESLYNATVFDAGDPETGKGGEQITDSTYNRRR